MVQNVLTVVWPEIPTVPGMVSPAPDTTLLESTPAGGNSIYTHPSVQESFSFYRKCLQELSSVCTFNSRPPLPRVPFQDLALKVTMLWSWFPKSLSQTLRDMPARCYVMPISIHLITFFLFPSLLPSFAHAHIVSVFLFTHRLHFHHMFKITPFLLLSHFLAGDSGGRMCAMATLSSCAMGCKLMVSV